MPPAADEPANSEKKKSALVKPPAADDPANPEKKKSALVTPPAAADEPLNPEKKIALVTPPAADEPVNLGNNKASVNPKFLEFVESLRNCIT